MTLSRAGIAAVAMAGLLSACTATDDSGSATPLTVTAVGPHRISIEVTEERRFEPDEIVIEVGQTVTFLGRNRTGSDHEFYLGTEAEQLAHDEVMHEPGFRMHVNEDNAMFLRMGATNQLTYTFDTPGELIFGCHVDDHYGSGMRGTITVVEG